MSLVSGTGRAPPWAAALWRSGSLAPVYTRGNQTRVGSQPFSLGAVRPDGDIGEEKREARAAGPPPSCGPPAPSAACAGRRPLHAERAWGRRHEVRLPGECPLRREGGRRPLRASALNAPLSGFFFSPLLAVLRPAGHRLPPRQPQLHPRWQQPRQSRGEQDLPLRPEEVSQPRFASASGA